MLDWKERFWGDAVTDAANDNYARCHPRAASASAREWVWGEV